MLDLVRTSRVPLTDQIVVGFTTMIERRQLAEGTRLPSVRRLSRQLGVSAFTIVTAYDRLAALGTIEPRAGTGFFVARRIADTSLARIEAPPETPTPRSASPAPRSIWARSRFWPAPATCRRSGWPTDCRRPW